MGEGSRGSGSANSGTGGAPGSGKKQSFSATGVTLSPTPIIKSANPGLVGGVRMLGKFKMS